MANQAEYKKLCKLWYSKLRAEGFNDIESNNMQFKGGSLSWKFNSDWTTAYSQKAKQDYYALVNEFLDTHVFPVKIHEIIWAYHAEGISIRSITRLLKDSGVLNNPPKRGKYVGQARPYTKDLIQRIVAHYKNIMKEKLLK